MSKERNGKMKHQARHGGNVTWAERIMDAFVLVLLVGPAGIAILSAIMGWT